MRLNGLLGLLLLSGCFGPRVSVLRLREDDAQRLAQEVPILDADAPVSAMDHLDEVSAVSCRNKIWDKTASEEDALNQLRYRATLMGGNALAPVLCERPEGTNLLRNCWTSVTCHGAAVRVSPAVSLNP
jgi:hypothetical protein